MLTLNIIGCGRLGRTLARLWHESGVFDVRDVVNRSRESARSAVAFVGAGRPVSVSGELRPADLFLIGTPDGRIAATGDRLAASGLLRAGDIVFHCSGALSSDALESAREMGARVASVHPVKSFADPAGSVATFTGTYCGAEGCTGALDVLVPAFERIGGRVFQLDAGSKAIYHAASVIVCNYLNALLELGSRTFERSGIERRAAFEIMQPIVRGTVDNVFELGTVAALTGPIARGDHETVARHLDQLSAWDPDAAEVYRRLGAIALELSRAQGKASDESLSVLAELLTKRV